MVAKFRKLLNEFAEKSIEILIHVVEKIDVPEMLRDVFDFKDRLRDYFVIHVFTTVGLTVSTLGLISYFRTRYVFLTGGVGEIMAGVGLLFFSLMLYIIHKRR